MGTTNERGEEIPSRLFPVFRDEEELPANADLSEPIVRALENSSHLLVICSPGAASSRFVADEIIRFKALGRSDLVLAAIISGEPNVSSDYEKQRLGFRPEQECFPLPLRYEVEPDASVSERRAEPIAADFRVDDGQEGWTSPEAYRRSLQSDGATAEEASKKVEAYDKRLTLMKLKILAGIIGVPLGVLTQRDKAHQLQLAQKRTRVLRCWLAAIAILAIVACGMGAVALRARAVAVQERDRAEDARQAAESLARQRKENADVLEEEISPLIYHVQFQSGDLKLQDLAWDVLAGIKGLLMPEYDPTSFRKSVTSALLCGLIVSSEILNNPQRTLKSIRGDALEDNERQELQTALDYATQMDDILSRLMHHPDFDKHLSDMEMTTAEFQKIRAEALLSKGTALIHVQHYDAAIPLLEKFVFAVDSWELVNMPKWIKYHNLFEGCTSLAHAYRLTGRKELAIKTAHKALDNGGLLAASHPAKKIDVALRYITINHFFQLDAAYKAKGEAYVKKLGISKDEIIKFRMALDGDIETTLPVCKELVPDSRALQAGIQTGCVILEWGTWQWSTKMSLESLFSAVDEVHDRNKQVVLYHPKHGISTHEFPPGSVGIVIAGRPRSSEYVEELKKAYAEFKEKQRPG